MAADPTIAVLSITPDRWRNRAVLLYAAMVDYWALTKPEMNFLIGEREVLSWPGKAWYHSLLWSRSVWLQRSWAMPV
jgi:hypothetical protein